VFVVFATNLIRKTFYKTVNKHLNLNNRLNKLIFTLVVITTKLSIYAQSARTIGYIPTYRFSVSNQIDYCKLTHLNRSFANPDSAGNIIMPPINSVVTDALNDYVVRNILGDQSLMSIPQMIPKLI
jgi:hypothetical protein